MIIQATPPEWGHYLTGFADGEGSFVISLRQRPDHSLGWQIELAFSVAQKEAYILSQFKRYLKCGAVRARHDGTWLFVVSNPRALIENVVPFFERFPFRSQRKKYNFLLFKKAVSLVAGKKQYTKEGLDEILEIRELINQGAGRKRKYSANDVHASIQENPQRLYAKPRAFRIEKHR